MCAKKPRVGRLRHRRRLPLGAGNIALGLGDLALQRIRDFRVASGGAIPLIGVGGIASADDAYARIRAGASLIQIYSGMVYEGPTLAKRINQGLIERLTRDGISHVAEAVGIG